MKTPPRWRQSKLGRFDDSAIMQFKAKWMALDTKVKGVIAENHVSNKLATLGYDVWNPQNPGHKADMGIAVGGKLIRIQVKSAQYEEQSKRFRSMLETKNKRGRTKYSAADVDFFIIWCAAIDVFYVIPIGVTEIAIDCWMSPHRDRLHALRAGSVDWEEYKNAFHLLQ